MPEIIKKLRIEQNISIDIMLKLLGLKTKAAYYKKESGRVKFALHEIKIISEYFGVETDLLLGVRKPNTADYLLGRGDIAAV